MFKRDQSAISAYALQGPDQMARVITFVYLTVQQSIVHIPKAMQKVDQQGDGASDLWGWKREAYRNLMENKDMIFEESTALHFGIADPYEAELATLMHFSQMPGLGLIKGGFCNQLIYGETGCMDTNNISIYGLNPRAFRADSFKKAGMKGKRKKAYHYAYTCWDRGGCEFLWDNWCNYVGERTKLGGDRISAIHTEAILQ